MEEHNGAHNTRNHELSQNHSLPTMSTTEIVIIFKTKDVSPKLKKMTLARNIVDNNRYIPARSPNHPPKGLEGHVREFVPRIINRRI